MSDQKMNSLQYNCWDGFATTNYLLWDFIEILVTAFGDWIERILQRYAKTSKELSICKLPS